LISSGVIILFAATVIIATKGQPSTHPMRLMEEKIQDDPIRGTPEIGRWGTYSIACLPASVRVRCPAWC
jgi:hypothetical protein